MVSSKVNSFIKRGHRILELKYPVMHSFLNGDNSQGHSLAKLALQLRILAHTHRFGSGGFGWSASAWGRLSNTFGRCEYRNDTTHINTYHISTNDIEWPVTMTSRGSAPSACEIPLRFLVVIHEGATVLGWRAYFVLSFWNVSERRAKQRRNCLILRTSKCFEGNDCCSKLR